MTLQFVSNLAVAKLDSLLIVLNVIATGLLSWFVPCYIHGKAAESVGESCILHGIMWFLFEPAALIMMAMVRSKIREQKGIEVC